MAVKVSNVIIALKFMKIVPTAIKKESAYNVQLTIIEQ